MVYISLMVRRLKYMIVYQMPNVLLMVNVAVVFVRVYYILVKGLGKDITGIMLTDYKSSDSPGGLSGATR